jgi:hypothetical protein
VPPLVIVGAILLFYVLLGCVMDELSMLLLTIPVIFPAVMGLDLWGLQGQEKAIWFGILVLMTVGIGLIAPPVGLNVYVVNSLARDVPMGETYQAACSRSWPGDALRLPLRLTHLHVGGVNHFEGPSNPGPYVIGGLGITQLTPNLPGTRSRTRASLNVGVGHAWALAPALTLRAELRAYVVAIGSDGAFFCSGGCTVSIRADTLTQAEAAIGLRLAF